MLIYDLFSCFSLSEENGVFFVEFVPQDVGTYIMDVFASGQKLSDSPVFYKVYDATLIRITEAGSGVVGQPCQFKVDASQAVSICFIDKIKIKCFSCS